MNNHRKFSKAVEAVSPVVATLLLVLVAAGAAIGFGVFLNGFQEKTQDNVATDSASTVLTVGGSSTVYEWSVIAMEEFMAVNPSIEVTLSHGGSTAGVRAVCSGFIDVGSSSSTVPASGRDGADLASCPDFDQDGDQDVGKALHVQKIAYDGIVIALGDDAETAHTCGTLQLTKNEVRELYRVNGRGDAPAGVAVGSLALATGNGGTEYAWVDLPGTCAGTEVIQLYQRQDPGGTEDAFCGKMMSSSSDCSNGELSGFDGAIGCFGNAALIACIEGDADGLSFISFGDASLSGLSIAEFDGIEASEDSIRDGANGVSGGYGASRTLYYITAGAPSALEQLWIDWNTDPSRNQDLAEATGYVSLY